MNINDIVCDISTFEPSIKNEKKTEKNACVQFCQVKQKCILTGLVVLLTTVELIHLIISQVTQNQPVQDVLMWIKNFTLKND